jgi:hypothetical protein
MPACVSALAADLAGAFCLPIYRIVNNVSTFPDLRSGGAAIPRLSLHFHWFPHTVQRATMETQRECIPAPFLHRLGRPLPAEVLFSDNLIFNELRDFQPPLVACAVKTQKPIHWPVSLLAPWKARTSFEALSDQRAFQFVAATNHYCYKVFLPLLLG